VVGSILAEVTVGIREKLNNSSGIATGAVIVVLLVSVAVIAIEIRGNSGEAPKKCYYSIDDGKTWFSDASKNLPPYDYDGSPAVRCYVFSGPNGKFVGLLEKYSDDTRAAIVRNGGAVPMGTPVLIKKPGEGQWRSAGGNDEAMVLLDIVGRPDSGIDRVMP
jgi:hypothetical protein